MKCYNVNSKDWEKVVELSIKQGKLEAELEYLKSLLNSMGEVAERIGSVVSELKATNWEFQELTKFIKGDSLNDTKE